MINLRGMRTEKINMQVEKCELLEAVVYNREIKVEDVLKVLRRKILISKGLPADSYKKDGYWKVKDYDCDIETEVDVRPVAFGDAVLIDHLDDLEHLVEANYEFNC